MRMKVIAACTLALASAALADPVIIGAPPPAGPPKLVFPSKAPAKRMPASARYSAQALSLFVDAIVYDKRGDLELASRNYRDANAAGEQANTYYNLADLERRRENYPDAITAYEKY